MFCLYEALMAPCRLALRILSCARARRRRRTARPFLARQPGGAAVARSRTVVRPSKAGAANADLGARMAIAALGYQLSPSLDASNGAIAIRTTHKQQAELKAWNQYTHHLATKLG